MNTTEQDLKIITRWKRPEKKSMWKRSEILLNGIEHTAPGTVDSYYSYIFFLYDLNRFSVRVNHTETRKQKKKNQFS